MISKMVKPRTLKLKKGDQVLIITGKDRGRRGAIEKVLSRQNKIIVTGVNIAKRHLKPSRKNPHGGIISQPSPMDASNVLIVCPRCDRPTRIGYRILKEKKMRLCRKCQESLE